MSRRIVLTSTLKCVASEADVSWTFICPVSISRLNIFFWAGKKETHWIWYIFPQMRGLGKSERSKFYAIQDRDEAIAYINNPVLRDRLVEITEAVYNSEKTVYEIFGNDAIKVRSCMFLFASVCDIPIFKKMIQKYSWR